MGKPWFTVDVDVMAIEFPTVGTEAEYVYIPQYDPTLTAWERDQRVWGWFLTAGVPAPPIRDEDC